VFPAPPTSTATIVLGPKAAVNGNATGLLGAVALETSTSVISLASGEVNASASWSFFSNGPRLNPVTSLRPLGRQSTHVKTPGANW